MWQTFKDESKQFDSFDNSKDWEKHLDEEERECAMKNDTICPSGLTTCDNMAMEGDRTVQCDHCKVWYCGLCTIPAQYINDVEYFCITFKENK